MKIQSTKIKKIQSLMNFRDAAVFLIFFAIIELPRDRDG